MRNGLLSLLSVLCAGILLCAGCDMPDHKMGDDLYEVAFILDGGGAETTRSTAVRDETYLREWCLYVADANGNVCNALSVTGSPYATGNYPAGTYTAFAVVNCGMTEAEFTTEEDIKSYRRFLAEEKSAFTMYGSCEFRVPADNACSIPISRLVSKVEIDEVRTDFSQYPDLYAGSFTIDSIYLINVAGESSMAGNETLLPGIWYNKLGYESGNADALLCDAAGFSVAPGAAYSVPHYFYCYQNSSTSDSNFQIWSPRHTRLVLECTLSGRKTYYPVDIVSEDGKLVRNCRYLISELVITDIGADAPDGPLGSPLPYRFSTVTVPWDVTFQINEDF